MKKHRRSGVVYSTNPDFEYEEEQQEQPETLPPGKQNLKVRADKKQRKGKTVTLVSGFIGNDFDLKILGKQLKTLCGTGGSVKDGEIIVQGDFVQKICEFLRKNGYKCKVAGC